MLFYFVSYIKKSWAFPIILPDVCTASQHLLGLQQEPLIQVNWFPSIGSNLTFQQIFPQFHYAIH